MNKILLKQRGLLASSITILETDLPPLPKSSHDDLWPMLAIHRLLCTLHEILLISLINIESRTSNVPMQTEKADPLPFSNGLMETEKADPLPFTHNQ